MTSFEFGLYVRIEELENGPKPFPLNSGFSTTHAYRALGLYNPSPMTVKPPPAYMLDPSSAIV